MVVFDRATLSPFFVEEMFLSRRPSCNEKWRTLDLSAVGKMASRRFSEA